MGKDILGRFIHSNYRKDSSAGGLQVSQVP